MHVVRTERGVAGLWHWVCSCGDSGVRWFVREEQAKEAAGSSTARHTSQSLKQKRLVKAESGLQLAKLGRAEIDA